MAKGEGRGWKKFLPSPVTIVKVFIAVVVIKIISTYVVAPYQQSLPAVVRNVWPSI